MKRILVIQGGGRPHGNTTQLVESFVRGAEKAGNSVEVISLNKHEVKDCLGCNACRYGKPCVQKDSFNEIVPRIKGADCIVFASAPLLLDNFFKAESIYRTLLLHSRGRPESAARQIRKIPS